MDNSRTKSDAINMMINIRRDLVVYHNQKENFAYLATFGYLGAVAYLLQDNAESNISLTWIYMLFPIAVFLYIAWQLIRRWEANVMVDICTKLATTWLSAVSLSPEDLIPVQFKGAFFPKAFCDLSREYPLEQSDWKKLRFLGRAAKFQLALIFISWIIIVIKYVTPQ